MLSSAVGLDFLVLLESENVKTKCRHLFSKITVFSGLFFIYLHLLTPLPEQISKKIANGIQTVDLGCQK